MRDDSDYAEQLQPLLGGCGRLSETMVIYIPFRGLGRIKKEFMQRTRLPDMFYGAKRTIFQNAELLRKNMTPAEKYLWERLNKNQLGVRFKAQHPIDIFIVDFYCHSFKLVVEVDGDIHLSQKEYDDGRTAELEKWDLTVIRFTNEEVLNDIESVVEEIMKYIKTAPSP
jgi:very-short-patch-repair endonuclease